MFEIIIGNLIKIGYAMAIFLCAYLANVVFSLWYNIKINCEPFSREKLATGGLKALTFCVSRSPPFRSSRRKSAGRFLTNTRNCSPI